MEKLLEIKDLVVHYKTSEFTVEAVNNISLSINRGESVGLVGETGAGKTTTALSIMQLIADPPGKIVNGEIYLDGVDLCKLSQRELIKIRGNKVSMIFQDPMTSLNPVITIGEQIAEVIRLHNKVSRSEAQMRAVDMLNLVGISEERFNDYPHQFSGGMKQRVIIAIALACNPELLIADEPTTALDVTIQAQVLDLMENLKKEFNTSLLMITHDLGVVAEICDKAAIMYAGEIVEYGNLEHIFNKTKHPYTKGLFESIPKFDEEVERLKPIVGLMPDPSNLPDGCSFAPRCPNRTEECTKGEIPAIEVEPGHIVKCINFIA
ncbi:MAG: ABC transporter ATP-binding protein [Tissierellia bacterium]|jgi:peptide/nickel transport system ATP-binding protein|nr:ABC transporter ATP-binding protein [Tissierellia bacterium]